MPRIFLAQDGFRRRNPPVDTQLRIPYRDAAVRLRSVVVVALVLENCLLAQHRETVCEAPRNEQLKVIFLRKLDGDMLSVSGTPAADVHRNVQNRPAHAPHQLRLCMRRPLEMKSPQHPIGRARLVVLDEIAARTFALKSRCEKLSKKYPRASRKRRGSTITTPSIDVCMIFIAYSAN